MAELERAIDTWAQIEDAARAEWLLSLPGRSDEERSLSANVIRTALRYAREEPDDALWSRVIATIVQSRVLTETEQLEPDVADAVQDLADKLSSIPEPVPDVAHNHFSVVEGEAPKRRRVDGLSDVFGDKLNLVQGERRALLEAFMDKKPPPSAESRVRIHEETNVDNGRTVKVTLYVILDWEKHSFRKTRKTKDIT